jgi:predicted RNA-binding protein with RPS1 domain
MNHIEDIKDYLIADEIQRIKSLSRDELERELISVKTLEIESSSVRLYENNYGN